MMKHVGFLDEIDRIRRLDGYKVWQCGSRNRLPLDFDLGLSPIVELHLHTKAESVWKKDRGNAAEPLD
jgi:hypothetical protein